MLSPTFIIGYMERAVKQNLGKFPEGLRQAPHRAGSNYLALAYVDEFT
jgi:hypothetical protein